VIGRVSEIQTRMTALTEPPAAAPRTEAAAAASTKAAAATTAPSGTAFAQALAAAAAPAATPGTATGAAVVEDAKKYLGVPYVWGGTDPKTGLDCSGLVQRVYKDLGIDLPRVAIDQGNAGTTVPDLASAKPGDLLVMHNGGHIGIYMGNNQYIHAPQPGESVTIADIPAGAVFDKITRIIPEAPAPAAPSALASQAAFLSGLSA
jgi:cell wall-associated NlpC family hydrolase